MLLLKYYVGSYYDEPLQLLLHKAMYSAQDNGAILLASNKLKYD